MSEPLTTRTTNSARLRLVARQAGRIQVTASWVDRAVRAVKDAWLIVKGPLWWGSVSIIILALLVGLISFVQPSDFALHVSQGDALSDNNALEGAVSEYREASRLKPDAAAVHAKLAQLLQITHKTEEALAEYSAVVRLAPEDWEPHYQIGLMLYDKHNFESSIQEFKEVLRLNPNNSRAHYYLGRSFEKRGAVKEALDEYGEACAGLANDSVLSASQRSQIRVACSHPAKSVIH